MGMRTWSTTPAANESLSGSAGAINWKENQAPSTVNDSARITLAEIKSWYDEAEWVTVAETGSIKSQTVFSLTGTCTATFHVGRRVRLTGGSATRYATITDQSFSGGGTQVTISVDSGSLSASMSMFAVGIQSALNTSRPGNNVYVGSLTRDMTAATGDVAYTGVGFKPTAIIAFGTVDGVAVRTSFGFGAGTTEQSVFERATGWGAGGSLLCQFGESGTSQTASIASMDADGFTLTWTKSGLPTGTATVCYLAIRL